MIDDERLKRVIPLRARWHDFWRSAVGRAMCKLRVPGFVREMSTGDDLTNSFISIRLSPSFTVIHVNGVDFYFHRFTGKFDGTGMVPKNGCRRPTEPRHE